MNTFMNEPAWNEDDAAFQIYDKRSKELGYLFGQHIHSKPVDGLGNFIFHFWQFPWTIT